MLGIRRGFLITLLDLYLIDLKYLDLILKHRFVGIFESMWLEFIELFAIVLPISKLVFDAVDGFNILN